MGKSGDNLNFTINVTDFENFDYLTFKKYTDGREEKIHTQKITKYDNTISYEGSNNGKVYLYYTLSSKDLDKQNEISIDFYNASGNQTDSYKFYFEIEPHLPGITVSYKEIAGRVGSSKSVDVFLYTEAGVQSLKIAKNIDEILNSSNDLDVPVDSLQLFDDYAYSYQINHDYTELEYNKKVVYKLTFTDNVNNTVDIDIEVSTLGPEPKRQSIYLTNVMNPDSDTWGVDSKRF